MAFKKTKTWYCDIIFCRPAFPELERECHIRIHDPELLLATSLEKSRRGTFLAGEDILSASEVQGFPTYGFLYRRELHISSVPGTTPVCHYPRMVIREGSLYLATSAAEVPWTAILRFLWQTGEQELYVKAMEAREASAAKKAASYKPMIEF